MGRSLVLRIYIFYSFWPPLNSEKIWIFDSEINRWNHWKIFKKKVFSSRDSINTVRGYLSKSWNFIYVLTLSLIIWILCNELFLSQEYKSVLANCEGSLMKCLGGGGEPCNGLASHPGRGAVILLVSSCYRNRHNVRLDEPLGSYTDFTSLIKST